MLYLACVVVKLTQTPGDLALRDPVQHILQIGLMCVWGVGWLHAVLHSKRSPKCGILSSKLRSPVCKEWRRRWGCGSMRAVSVWPAHVTCLLLRAMAVAKEQVINAAVVAMEQVVMAVVRAVSWCMRWCGEVRSQGSQADALSTVPTRTSGFLSLSKGWILRFVFQICPRVQVLILGVWGRERCVNKCHNYWKC